VAGSTAISTQCLQHHTSWNLKKNYFWIFCTEKIKWRLWNTHFKKHWLVCCFRKSFTCDNHIPHVLLGLRGWTIKHSVSAPPALSVCKAPPSYNNDAILSSAAYRRFLSISKSHFSFGFDGALVFHTFILWLKKIVAPLEYSCPKHSTRRTLEIAFLPQKRKGKPAFRADKYNSNKKDFLPIHDEHPCRQTQDDLHSLANFPHCVVRVVYLLFTFTAHQYTIVLLDDSLALFPRFGITVV